MVVPFAVPTSPSSVASTWPLPLASSQKRKPLCPPASVSDVKTITFRPSGRGVSLRSGEPALSIPSSDTAVTWKHSGTPLVRALTRKDGETVVPSVTHELPHRSWSRL